MSKKTAIEWLKMWGEWECYQRNIYSTLSYKPSMTALAVIVTHNDAPPAPTLSDDDQQWLCSVMASIKRESYRNYRILKMKFMLGYSQERIRSILKVSKNRSYEETNLAIFYAERIISDTYREKLTLVR